MHVCVRAGGRGVIEGLGKQLALSDALLEPSYASLYWYGNTSSASVWYALGFIEAARSLARGDVIWQVRPVWLCASGATCSLESMCGRECTPPSGSLGLGHLQGGS